MFKLLIFACLLAFAFAAAKPLTTFYSSYAPAAYSAYSGVAPYSAYGGYYGYGAYPYGAAYY